MGTPVRGASVTLGKNPGGGASARILPKGQYTLTFEIHFEVNDAPETKHDFEKLTFKLDDKTDIVVSVVTRP